ncbi:MAG: hypothetical protein WB797_09245 [Nocardioides sp.]
MRQPPRRLLGGVAITAALLGAVLAVPSSATGAVVASCPRTSLGHDIAKAKVVFRGVVTKSRPARGSGAQRTRSYKVSADRVYKSSLVTRSVLVTAHAGPGACTLPELTKGRRYFFFVNEKGTRLMATTATARATKHLTHQIEKRLGTGTRPETTPPASAQLTRVAHASPPSLSRLLAPGAAVLILSLLGLLVVNRLGRRPA